MHTDSVRKEIKTHLAHDVTNIVMDYALKPLCDYIWPFIYTTKPLIRKEGFHPRDHPITFFTVDSSFVFIEYDTTLVEYRVLDSDVVAVYDYFKLHFPHLLQLDVAQHYFGFQAGFTGNGNVLHATSTIQFGIETN